MAVPPLVDVLRQDPSVTIARALSEYGPDAQSSIPDLIALLTNEELDTELRWNAARTLGKIREPAVAALDVLVASLDDKEATIREHSAEALGDIGPPAAETVPALIAVLDDPATRVRRDAARSLGQIGPAARPAVESLKKLLKDPEEIVRDAAQTAIKTLAPEEALDGPPPERATTSETETKPAP